jgi:hypothetical protein
MLLPHTRTARLHAACADAPRSRAARKAKPAVRTVRDTPARKPRRPQPAAEEPEAEWEDGQESEEEGCSFGGSDGDEAEDYDAVPESPAVVAPRGALYAPGALVRPIPAGLSRLRRRAAPSPPQPPSVRDAATTPRDFLRASTPRAPPAPPRWRLKGTVRVPTEVRLTRRLCMLVH